QKNEQKPNKSGPLSSQIINLKPSARMRWLAGLLLVSVLAGCTTRHYRKSADKESYRAIKAKSPKVPNMDPRFTIEQTNLLSFEGLPVTSSVEEFLGLEAERERGAHILNL